MAAEVIVFKFKRNLFQNTQRDRRALAVKTEPSAQVLCHGIKISKKKPSFLHFWLSLLFIILDLKGEKHQLSID